MDTSIPAAQPTDTVLPPKVNADHFLKENITLNNADTETTTQQRPTLRNPPPPSTSTSIPTTQSHEEHQYLSLIRQILTHGEYRPDRTGTGTLSLFTPAPLRFTLSRTNPSYSLSPPDASEPSHTAILPLLTTKRVFTRGVLAELLWFLRGSTNARELSSQNVHIWDGNGSRAFLDSLGPPQSLREEGDLGPVYGFQWRHWGAEYSGCDGGEGDGRYEGKGVDQIKDVIEKLRGRPYDRRILLSAWNVGALGEMALPPCHLLAQFYVSFGDVPRGVDAYRAWKEQQEQQQQQQHGGQTNGTTNGTNTSNDTTPPTCKPKTRGTLHCTLFQRSADTGLGIPFNIASYALLTHMLAHACDLIPGTFTMVLGDAHVYVDHIDALRDQLAREPREFPTLRIERGDRGEGCVDGWRMEDFIVEGYRPHAGVRMKMSV